MSHSSDELPEGRCTLHSAQSEMQMSRWPHVPLTEAKQGNRYPQLKSLGFPEQGRQRPEGWDLLPPPSHCHAE